MNDLVDFSFKILLSEFKAFDGYAFHMAGGIWDLYYLNLAKEEDVENL